MDVMPFEKPIGFSDLLPEVTQKKRLLESVLHKVFTSWGYAEMMTPTLEYDEIVGKASKIQSAKVFRLLDRQGRTLVLRPDMTAPIARVVSSLLKDQKWPIRLSYHTNVFRAQENEAGRSAEFFQSGVELVGEGTPDADAEILAVAYESLNALEVGSFKLTVNHMGFINGIFDEWIVDVEKQEVLKGLLSVKNFVGYQEKVREFVVDVTGKEVLTSIIGFQGDIQALIMAKEKTNSAQAQRALEDLIEIYRLLEIYQVDDNINFDLSLIPHLEYYTGMVFEGTAEKIGFPICSGGRYDSLLDVFNNSQQAIGFALKINRILEISKLQTTQKKRVRIIYDKQNQENALRYASKLRLDKEIVVETFRADYNDISNRNETEDVELILFKGEGQTNDND